MFCPLDSRLVSSLSISSIFSSSPWPGCVYRRMNFRYTPLAVQLIGKRSRGCVREKNVRWKWSATASRWWWRETRRGRRKKAACFIRYKWDFDTNMNKDTSRTFLLTFFYLVFFLVSPGDLSIFSHTLSMFVWTTLQGHQWPWKCARVKLTHPLFSPLLKFYLMTHFYLSNALDKHLSVACKVTMKTKQNKKYK